MLPKHHTLFEVNGDLDELNSFIGLLRQNLKNIDPPVFVYLEEVQKSIFYFGTLLSASDASRYTFDVSIIDVWVKSLEKHIDSMEGDLQPLRNFILPGGSLPSVSAHQSRAICRRTERSYSFFREHKKFEGDFLISSYLNRLSDYLFVLARWINVLEGDEEITWNLYSTGDSDG